MERIEAELFTDGSNNAVVRLPGRRFPGVLVQGDSLSILRAGLAEIRAACAAGDLEEAGDLSDLLLEDLDAMLLRYTDALARHGLPKPF